MDTSADTADAKWLQKADKWAAQYKAMKADENFGMVEGIDYCSRCGAGLRDDENCINCQDLNMDAQQGYEHTFPPAKPKPAQSSEKKKEKSKRKRSDDKKEEGKGEGKDPKRARSEPAEGKEEKIVQPAEAKAEEVKEAKADVPVEIKPDDDMPIYLHKLYRSEADLIRKAVKLYKEDEKINSFNGGMVIEIKQRRLKMIDDFSRLSKFNLLAILQSAEPLFQKYYDDPEEQKYRLDKARREALDGAEAMRSQEAKKIDDGVMAEVNKAANKMDTKISKAKAKLAGLIAGLEAEHKELKDKKLADAQKLKDAAQERHTELSKKIQEAATIQSVRQLVPLSGAALASGSGSGSGSGSSSGSSSSSASVAAGSTVGCGFQGCAWVSKGATQGNQMDSLRRHQKKKHQLQGSKPLFKMV